MFAAPRYPPFDADAPIEGDMTSTMAVCPADTTPLHDALGLTEGGVQARIVLLGQVYSLRITRAGKLVLTK